MKGSRLVAVSMLLLLIFACFISVPVLAEGPWDADHGSSGDPGSNKDSTDDGGDDGVLDNGKGENPGQGLSWFSDLTFKFVMNLFIRGLIGISYSAE